MKVVKPITKQKKDGLHMIKKLFENDMFLSLLTGLGFGLVLLLADHCSQYFQ